MNEVWSVVVAVSSVVDALYAELRPYNTCEVPPWSVVHVTVAPVSVGVATMPEIMGRVVPTSA